MLFGQCCFGLVGQHFDLTNDELIGLDAGGEHPEPFFAHGVDAENAVVESLKVSDSRQRAHLVMGGRVAGLFAFQDKTYPEGLIASHTFRHHVHVARLEYTQRQRATRKQHRVQWKQRDFAGSNHAPALLAAARCDNASSSSA